MERYQSLLAELAYMKDEVKLMEKTPGRWRVGASIVEMEATLAKLHADAAEKAPKKTDQVCCAECGIRRFIRDTWIHPELEGYALAEFLAERVCYSCLLEIENQMKAEYEDDYEPYSPEPDYESENSLDERPVCPCRDWMCPGDCGTQPCGVCIDTCKCDREW